MIDKLKQYMDENELTQVQLCSLLNMSQTHLSKVLNGKREPGGKLVKAYYALPGIKEKETINEVYQLVNNLWINGYIDDRVTKKILQELEG